MDAAEFLRARRKLCNDNVCEESCPLFYCCDDNTEDSHIRQVLAVEQWAKEHPVKTRQSELKKLFPDLTLEDGWFCMCPKYVGQKECIDGPLEKSTCDKCRRDFWLEEIE